MGFSDMVKNDARLRQDEKCGLCGNRLNNIREIAHHVIPKALGGPDEVSNCVVLCDSCKYNIHNNGNYNSLVVMRKESFIYANWDRQKIDDRWV